MTRKLTLTPRGFELLELKDSNGERYDLQESSSAEDNFIWIWCYNKEGKREGGIHLNKEKALELSEELHDYFILHTFINGTENE